MKIKGLIPAALAIGVASAALAHTGATGIVKERMVPCRPWATPSRRSPP